MRVYRLSENQRKISVGKNLTLTTRARPSGGLFCVCNRCRHRAGAGTAEHSPAGVCVSAAPCRMATGQGDVPGAEHRPSVRHLKCIPHASTFAFLLEKVRPARVGPRDWIRKHPNNSTIDVLLTQMQEINAIRALSALAHEARLRIFRALVVAGPEGLTPSALAEQLGIAPNALSFHLKELSHAELVSQERHGRNVLYRAEFPTMNDLLAYLTENCCQGAPCTPASATACKC